MSLPEWKTRHVDGDDWNITFAPDAKTAAELEAESYCQWVVSWQSPVRVEVEGHGLFDVEIETVPVFTAKPIVQNVVRT